LFCCETKLSAKRDTLFSLFFLLLLLEIHTQQTQTDKTAKDRRGRNAQKRAAAAKIKSEKNITKNPRWRKDLAEEEEEEEEKKEKEELRKLFFQQNLLPNRKSKRDKRNVEAFWKR
jgi:hypothetical protein